MYKIYDVRPQGLLAPEAFAVQPVSAQVIPEQLFCVCHVLAEMFCELILIHLAFLGWIGVFILLIPLSPTPLPQGERG